MWISDEGKQRFAIGPVELAVAPEDIRISRFENNQEISWLRHPGSLKIPTGQTSVRVDISFSISTGHHGAPQNESDYAPIDDVGTLAMLVAMTRVTPFVPVVNEYLLQQMPLIGRESEIMGLSDTSGEQAVPMAITSFGFVAGGDAPEILQCQMSMLYWNPNPFIGIERMIWSTRSLECVSSDAVKYIDATTQRIVAEKQIPEDSRSVVFDWYEVRTYTDLCKEFGLGVTYGVGSNFPGSRMGKNSTGTVNGTSQTDDVLKAAGASVATDGEHMPVSPRGEGSWPLGSFVNPDYERGIFLYGDGVHEGGWVRCDPDNQRPVDPLFHRPTKPVRINLTPENAVDVDFNQIVTGLSANFQNRLVVIPLEGSPYPTIQHLGAQDSMVNLSVAVKSTLETFQAVKQVQSMLHNMSTRAVNYRGKIFGARDIMAMTRISVANKLLAACGLYDFAITSSSFNRDPDSPELVRLELTLTEMAYTDKDGGEQLFGYDNISDPGWRRFLRNWLLNFKPEDAPSGYDKLVKILLKLRAWDLEADNVAVRNNLVAADAQKQPPEAFVERRKANVMLLEKKEQSLGEEVSATQGTNYRGAGRYGGMSVTDLTSTPTSYTMETVRIPPLGGEVETTVWIDDTVSDSGDVATGKFELSISPESQKSMNLLWFIDGVYMWLAGRKRFNEPSGRSIRFMKEDFDQIASCDYGRALAGTWTRLSQMRDEFEQIEDHKDQYRGDSLSEKQHNWLDDHAVELKTVTCNFLRAWTDCHDEYVHSHLTPMMLDRLAMIYPDFFSPLHNDYNQQSGKPVACYRDLFLDNPLDNPYKWMDVGVEQRMQEDMLALQRRAVWWSDAVFQATRLAKRNMDTEIRPGVAYYTPPADPAGQPRPMTSAPADVDEAAVQGGGAHTSKDPNAKWRTHPLPSASNVPLPPSSTKPATKAASSRQGTSEFTASYAIPSSMAGARLDVRTWWTHRNDWLSEDWVTFAGGPDSPCALAISYILDEEGGYHLWDAKNGGATNHGIIQTTAQGLFEKGLLNKKQYDKDNDGRISISDMKQLTDADAAYIYKRFFWDAVGLGKLTSPAAAAKIFQIGVIEGPGNVPLSVSQALKDMTGKTYSCGRNGVLSKEAADAINALTDGGQAAKFLWHLATTWYARVRHQDKSANVFHNWRDRAFRGLVDDGAVPIVYRDVPSCPKNGQDSAQSKTETPAQAPQQQVSGQAPASSATTKPKESIRDKALANILKRYREDPNGLMESEIPLVKQALIREKEQKLAAGQKAVAAGQGTSGNVRDNKNIALTSQEEEAKAQVGVEEYFKKAPESVQQALESANNMGVEQFTIKRSFPAFKLFFVQEDNDGLIAALDEYYGWNAIIDWQLHEAQGRPATLVVTLTNLFNHLDAMVVTPGASPRKIFDERARDIQDPGTSKVVMHSKNGGVSEETAGGQTTDIQNIMLKPGTKIVLKAGYDNNPDNLYTIFAGQVTEISAGDVMQITCQDWASELLAMYDQSAGPYELHRNWVKSAYDWLLTGNAADATGTAGTRKVLLALLAQQSVRHLGRWQLGVPDVDKVGGYSWQFVDEDYKDAVKEGGIKAVNRSMENVRPEPMPYQSVFGTFNTKENVDFEHKTMWECIQDLRLRHCNNVTFVRPYGRGDGTLYFGPPWGTYNTDDRFALQNPALRKEVLELDFDGFKEVVLNHTIKVNHVSIDDQGNVELDAWDNGFGRLFEEAKNSVAAHLFNRYNSDAGVQVQTWRMLVNRRVTRYLLERLNKDDQAVMGARLTALGRQQGKPKNFAPTDEALKIMYDLYTQSKSRGFASSQDTVTINDEEWAQASDVVSKIDAEVRDYKIKAAREKMQSSNPDEAATYAKIFDELQKTTRPVRKWHLVSSKFHIINNGMTVNNDFSNAVSVTDGEVPFLKFDPGLDELRTKAFPEYKSYDSTLRGFVMLSLLAEEMKKMYRGEIVLVGNPDIRPYDVIQVVDDTRQIYGLVEVDTVVHSMSVDTGFITIVTPALLVEAADMTWANAWHSYYLSLATDIKELRERGMIGRGAANWLAFSHDPFVALSSGNNSELFIRYYANGEDAYKPDNTFGWISYHNSLFTDWTSDYNNVGWQGKLLGGSNFNTQAIVIGTGLCFLFPPLVFVACAGLVANMAYNAFLNCSVAEQMRTHPLTIIPVVKRGMAWTAGIEGSDGRTVMGQRGYNAVRGFSNVQRWMEMINTIHSDWGAIKEAKTALDDTSAKVVEQTAAKKP